MSAVHFCSSIAFILKGLEIQPDIKSHVVIGSMRGPNRITLLDEYVSERRFWKDLKAARSAMECGNLLEGKEFYYLPRLHDLLPDTDADTEDEDTNGEGENVNDHEKEDDEMDNETDQLNQEAAVKLPRVVAWFDLGNSWFWTSDDDESSFTQDSILSQISAVSSGGARVYAGMAGYVNRWALPFFACRTDDLPLKGVNGLPIWSSEVPHFEEDVL